MQEFIRGMKNPMVKYIRTGGKHNKKRGVMLSGVMGGEVCFGWSLCNKIDEFNPYIGIDIARDRCEVNSRFEKYLEYQDDLDCFGIFEIIPQSIQNDIFYFTERMKKYYKDRPTSELVNFLYEYTECM